MKLKALFLCAAAAALPAAACTSAIVAASATACGRPMIWKHRDTSADNNFLYRVEQPGRIGYVGLFNGGDTLCLDEAWMGMNDAGFAIINTVAYNLPANDPAWADREGYVMAEALGRCRSVDDFEALLLELPKPLGVRTDFGVIDADGNGAYFETDDYNVHRFNLADAPDGILIRTNYAYSGTTDYGMGYIRHQNVREILQPQIDTGSLTPESLTEGVSRCFYNSLTRTDALDSPEEWIVDQDFVPRRSSTASIVIEGVAPGDPADGIRMWAVLGYPPCSHVVKATLHDIPSEASATPQHPRSTINEEASELRALVFPIQRGSGQRYINIPALRQINAEQHQLSLKAYQSR